MKKRFFLSKALFCAIVLAGLFSCSNMQKRDTATISLIFDNATLSHLVRTNARSAQFDIADTSNAETAEAPHETCYLTIALLGDYSDTQTKEFVFADAQATDKTASPDITFTFDDINVGTSLYARALLSVADANGFVTACYYGTTSPVTVKAGTNTLPLTMHDIRKEESSTTGSGTTSTIEGTLILMAFENGMYTISHNDYGDISVGTYEILKKDADENPTSIVITETAYRTTTDNVLQIVTSPQSQTLAVTNGSCTFTSSSGGTITIQWKQEAADMAKLTDITVTLEGTSVTDEGENVTLTASEQNGAIVLTATPKTGTTVDSYAWLIDGEQAANATESTYTVSAETVKTFGAGNHDVTLTVYIGGEPYSVQTTFTVLQ